LEDAVSPEQLPITCPLCGKKNEFPLDTLFEGSDFQCPFCKVKLKLHGHMWEDIQGEIAKLKQKA
jgi:hypothetical protein